MGRSQFLAYDDPQFSSEAERWEQSLFNPEVFIFLHGKTYDETDAEHPVKPFPRHAYLRSVIYWWQKERLLAIVKSRRLVITWLLCGLDLWQAMTQQHAAVYIAAKKQENSDKLIKRCAFIYENLSPGFPKPAMTVHLGQAGDPTRLDFPELGSKIEALSEDPEGLRQEGASRLHVEEYQVFQHSSQFLRAALPVIENGGKMVIVGTALSGTNWERLITDDLGQPVGR